MVSQSFSTPNTENHYKEIDQINFQILYADRAFIPMNTGMKSTFGINIFETFHLPFSKHFASIFKSGGGLQTARLYGTPTIGLNNEVLIKQTYSYIKLLAGAGIRYSGSHDPDLHGTGFEFDLSLNYQLPLFFQQILSYQNSKRVVNSKLHQFTDFSICLSGGYSTLRFFVDYRLLNYLIGKYVEFPRLQCGVIFSIDQE